MSRWFSVTALVYAAWVLYAGALGFAMRALEPAIPQYGPLPFFVGGSVFAAFLAPLTGFCMVRAVNRSVVRPEDDERWWWMAHRLVGQMIVVATVVAAIGALLGAAAGSVSTGLFFGAGMGTVLTVAPKATPPT